MTIQAPKEADIKFVVTVYKDMEFADEIEFCKSFNDYKSALDCYNEEVAKSEGTYFVELTLETLINNDLSIQQVVHNFEDEKRKVTVEAPEEVEAYFVVQTYKDMDYTDGIENSNSFNDYNSALEVYNNLVNHSNGSYLVTLALETAIDSEYDCILLADNQESEVQ